MGILSRVKGFFSGSASQSAGGLLASIMQSGLAPRRGTQQLLQAYRTSPWLHSVVHRIASEVGGSELELFKTEKPKARPQKRLTRAGVTFKPGDAVEVDSHPFLDLLDNPNPVLTRGALLYLVAAYLDIKGEVPVVIERNGAGAPIELWPVPPHWLIETPTRFVPMFRFSWSGWQRSIPEADVLYLRLPDLEQPYGRGVGIAETLADEIDIDEFLTAHLKSWFFNRAMPDVFLYVEGIKSETEAKRYEEALRSKHGGRGKAHQVHVTNGKVTLTQVGHTFKDMQVPDLRDQSRDVILQVFNMPPEVMGIVENSNRATIDAAYYLFARGVLSPRLAFICDNLTSWVRSEYEDASLSVGFCSPIPEDDDFRLRVMQAQPTLFAKNEWRELAGGTPIEGWDEEFPDAPAALPFGAPEPPSGDNPTPPEDPNAEPVEPEDEEDVIPADPEEERAAKRRRGLRRRLPHRV